MKSNFLYMFYALITMASLFSTTIEKLRNMHPLLKVALGACSGLIVRQVMAKMSRRLYSLPMGPEGWPILGIIPYMIMSNPLHLMAYTLANYGPITCYSLGIKHVILINDASLAKTIYSNPLTLEKQVRGTSNGHGVNLLNGEKWKNRRKILHLAMVSSLKTSFVDSETKLFFQQIVAKTVDEYCQKREPFDFEYILKPTTFNTMFISCFGRYLSSMDDPFWKQLNSRIKQHTSKTMIRMMKSMIFGEEGWVDHEWNDILKFVKHYIEQQVDTSNPDCIYSKLQQQDNGMSDNEIIGEIVGLFVGATEAVSTTMHFAILLLCKHPEIQTMIYNELRSLQQQQKSSDGIVLNTTNIAQIPYLRSLVHETLRLYPVTVATAPRAIRKSFVVDNVQSGCGTKQSTSYRIPKGSLLHVNTIAIARNPKYWMKDSGGVDARHVNMNELHLEFWLNEQGKFVLNKEAFTTFSIGKRDCIGRALAVKLIYIVLSCLLLRYRFYVQNVATFDIEGKMTKGPLVPKQSAPVFVEKRE